MKNKFMPKAAAVGIAAVLTVGMAGTVFADTCWTNPDAPVDVTTGTDANDNAYSSEITVAGHRAAQTLVEILGLNNKAAQNMAGNKDGVTDGDADQLDPEYNWIGSSKSTEGGGTKTALYSSAVEAGNNCKILGIFGSDLNSNPDPYYYNYYYDLYALTNDLTRVDDTQKILMIGTTSLSPDLADTLDNSADYPNSPDMAGVSVSVYTKPDILVGSQNTGKGTYSAYTYPQYIKEVVRTGTQGSAYTDYNPIVFKYSYNDVYQEGESLQRLATTVNSIATTNGSIDTDEINSSGKTEAVTRYGNPLVTANDFQLYIKGLSAYVAKQLEAKGIEKKTAVVIDPCSNTKGGDGAEEMPGTDWFRAYSNNTRDGLANRTRGAEAIENVTTNLLETYKNDSTKVSYIGDLESKAPKAAYAVTEAVVKEADVIVIQGAQSMVGDVFSEAEFKDYMKTNFGWTDADFADKTIIAENPQCVYGMTCNSSESAMAYGFYMGYIYPEILNPVDACGFFYKDILHVNDDAVDDFMACNITPYVSALVNSGKITGNLSDGYYETIRSDIAEGVNYFQGLDDTAKSEFYFQSRVSGAGTATGIFTTYNEATVNSILSFNVSKWNNPVGAVLAGTTCQAASVKKGTLADGTALSSAQIASITYTYESADPSIATVDADGTITGVANGDTTIYVTATLGTLTPYVYEESVHVGYADITYKAADGTETTISGSTLKAYFDGQTETVLGSDGVTVYTVGYLSDILDLAGAESTDCSYIGKSSDGFSTPILAVASNIRIVTCDGCASYRTYIGAWNNTSVSGLTSLVAYEHSWNEGVCDNCKVDQYTLSNGLVYDYNGELAEGAGVVYMNGALKYVKADATITTSGAKDAIYVNIKASKTNELLAEGLYKIDADGTIVNEFIKGNYYYKDGAIAAGAGIVSCDSDLYYVNNNGVVFNAGGVKDVYYTVKAAKTNDLVTAGFYKFGTDGKLVNSFIYNNTYYYTNGALGKAAGVVEVDGNLYYVNGKAAITKNTTATIREEKTNGLCDAGTYSFDANGVMSPVE